MLSFHHITKRFPGLTALDDVSLDLVPGEVHALVGENGAGKSTLIKIAGGIYAPESGDMAIAGESYQPTDPHDALEAGVRIVHQEFSLLPSLSIAENLMIERLPRRHGMVDRAAMNREAIRLMDEVGLDADPTTTIDRLGIAHQQLVEIARVIRAESRVLILDEPTATLTRREVYRLFEIVRQLRARGVTVVMVTHHLEEIFEIADRVSVLRNGRLAATTETSGITSPELVRLMIGRDVSEIARIHGTTKLGAERLVIRDVIPDGATVGCSFEVRAGEILGFAGLVGSGRTELVRALFGADPMQSGEIEIDGETVEIRSPADAVGHGLALLTEDRKAEGLMLDLSCNVNITIAGLEKITRHGMVQTDRERTVGTEMVGRLGIRKPSADISVRFLSGGNQQKVVLAKWLFSNARVFIFDEPTRGIDVGAKFEIYELLGELAERGMAIIVVSSDLPELLGICDRIGVFSRRELVGIVDHEDFSQERVLELAYSNYTRAADEVDAPSPTHHGAIVE